mgnify:CR=1 FL=1
MDNLLEIGRIARPHGLRGELLVSLTTNVADRLAPGSTVHAADRALVITASRPHQGKWIVTFDGITSREGADEVAHQPLRGEPVDDPSEPDALWVHELIGAEVVGVDGRSHGPVESVLDNPASDILELVSGKLVPLTFVVEVVDGRILVDPPVGLLDDDEAVVVLPSPESGSVAGDEAPTD